jgi:hypothetical protein
MFIEEACAEAAHTDMLRRWGVDRRGTDNADNDDRRVGASLVGVRIEDGANNDRGAINAGNHKGAKCTRKKPAGTKW